MEMSIEISKKHKKSLEKYKIFLEKLKKGVDKVKNVIIMVFVIS
jgi:hypothetical protein